MNEFTSIKIINNERFFWYTTYLVFILSTVITTLLSKIEFYSSPEYLATVYAPPGYTTHDVVYSHFAIQKSLIAIQIIGSTILLSVIFIDLVNRRFWISRIFSLFYYLINFCIIFILLRLQQYFHDTGSILTQTVFFVILLFIFLYPFLISRINFNFIKPESRSRNKYLYRVIAYYITYFVAVMIIQWTSSLRID